MKLERGFLQSRVARRIVALFVLCALIPISALALLSYEHVRKELVEQGYTHLAQLAEGYSASLYDRLIAVGRQMSGMATEADAPGARWTEGYRQTLRTEFDAIAVVGADGRTTVLLGAPRPFAPLSVTELGYLAKGEAVIRTSHAGGGSAPVVLAQAVDPARPERGALVVEIGATYLWGDSDALPALTDFCVADAEGSLLYCSQSRPSPAIGEFAARRTEPANGRFTFDGDDGPQIASYRELFLEPHFMVHGWTVIASRPAEDVLAPVVAFQSSFIPVIALALLVVALFSVTQVRRTLVPLSRLIEGTRRAGDQDFSTRVDVRSNDELGELAASFNMMNVRLGRQFTALSTLADIDRAILSRLDVDHVVETVVRGIQAIVPAHSVSVAILDRNAVDVMRVYSRGPGADAPVELERAPCTVEDTQELALHAEGVWLDATASVRPFTAAVRRLGATALFVLPIVWQGAVVGAVALGFGREAELSADDRARSHDLADRVGVAFAAAARDEQIYYQAHYDTLTGLPNRLYFKDQLVRTLAHAHRDRERFALLFIDLDFFKRVNDSLGHTAGDDVLREAASRLRGGLRDTDTLARLGGDEFTVVVSDIRSSRDPRVVAEHLIAALSAPFVVDSQEHFLSASIGIALYPDDGLTADELLRNADTAMYRAKDTGRGRCVFFEERMNLVAVARVRSERDLRRAVDEGEFVLHYQPLQDLGSGAIVAAEALLRWQHPERGLLSPEHFIGLAEETGLIDRLGEWVLREACAELGALQHAGIPLPSVSVNVSARQFRQTDFVSTVGDILRVTATPPGGLEIEITESLLLDANADVVRALDELKALGVRIALDDFGTGYSSLSYLKRFPVDVVKIDRSFVKDLPDDESSSAITGAIILMSHALHKQVVAEGVATAEQAAFLRRLGCDRLQGFYLSKPLPAAALAVFVRRAGGTVPVARIAAG
ncbi:MAG: EAL domain-containing protein [Betaproteobacteria bacterium]